MLSYLSLHACNVMQPRTCIKFSAFYEMKIRQRTRRGRQQVIWQCPKKSCRKERSVRHDCEFLAYIYENGKARCSLSLHKIMEILYIHLHTTPTNRQLQESTGCSPMRTTDWCNFIRKICSVVMVNQPKNVRYSSESCANRRKLLQRQA